MQINNNTDVRKQWGQTFRRLLLDRAVSNGEFRLFHLLYHHAGPSGCFAAIRTLSRELGSSPNAVSMWRDGLQLKGYLHFETDGPGRGSTFRLCDGQGEPLPLKPGSPASSTVSVTGTGNRSVTETSNAGVTGSGNGGVTETGNGGVTETGNKSVTGSGNLTKYKEENKRNGKRFITQSFIPQ
jgi:hypothetical protein